MQEQAEFDRAKVGDACCRRSLAAAAAAAALACHRMLALQVVLLLLLHAGSLAHGFPACCRRAWLSNPLPNCPPLPARRSG
jgi:hypothetical protein